MNALAFCLLLLGCSGSVDTPDDVGREAEEPAGFHLRGVRLDENVTAGELLGSEAPKARHEEASLVGGYEQQGNNQNPVLYRIDAGSISYRIRHETQPPDGRLLDLAWDGGPYAYGLFVIDGGGTDLEGKPAWLSSYAPGAISGGGPQVSVVGKIRVNTGALERATFVLSVLSSGRVNTHRPRQPLQILPNGDLAFFGTSAHKPIDAGGMTSMECTNDPFETEYRFDPDLTELRCASATNCTSSLPCSPSPVAQNTPAE